MTIVHASPPLDLDLNLLIALDVMLRERSVTRAASALGLTQSAMSHKLKRLRNALGDPLFVSGRHGLTPTPRAVALEQPLRSALHDLSAVLRVGTNFDPATSDRRVTFAASDLLELVMLPRMTRELAACAPGMQVVVQKRSPASIAALAAGELDFVIQPGARSVPGLDVGTPPGIRHRHLVDESFSVIARANHPRLSGRKQLTLKRFLAEGQVLVSPGGGPQGVVDVVLRKMGETRRVALRIPHFIGAPFIVAETDFLLTCPTGLAKAAAKVVPLRVMKPPIELPMTRVFMYWHERFQHDPAHRWLREFISEVVPPNRR